ncbi:MAG: hypothetical protein AB1540_09975 [Bdellovibrionota bacterium]
MKKNARQYTIRNIPEKVDQILKKRVRETRKSFNQVALEALAAGAEVNLAPKRDFSEIIGSLSDKEAARIEQEIRLQRQVDSDLWK